MTILEVLGSPAEPPHRRRQRWYRTLNEKTTSGDDLLMAEVVRDLNFARKTRGISPALEKMYLNVKGRVRSVVAEELAVAEGEADRLISRALGDS